MIERLLNFLNGKLPAEQAEDDLRIAVAALLVEAARMDDRFDESERQAIVRLLADRFAMAPEAALRLLEDAREMVTRSTQLFPFTSLAVKRLDEAERVRLIEMLWHVAYADGVLDPQEDMLVRRIAGLIHVSDRARGEAKLRALAQAGKGRH